MRSTTNLSRLTAATRPPVAPRRMCSGGAGRIDPEVIALAEALESTFDRGSTAYLEDVLPELEELRQLLERQLRRIVAESELASTDLAPVVAESSAERDVPQPRLCREFERLVEDARSRCLGVPNPPAFRWVANRFSLFRVALAAEPAGGDDPVTRTGVRNVFS